MRSYHKGTACDTCEKGVNVKQIGKGKYKHCAIDMNEELREFKLCPLVQDVRWEVKLIH